MHDKKFKEMENNMYKLVAERGYISEQLQAILYYLCRRNGENNENSYKVCYVLRCGVSKCDASLLFSYSTDLGKFFDFSYTMGITKIE